MIRSMLSIAAGYFSIAVLNSFVHLIVSVYFKTGLKLTGVSGLPSIPWVIGITALQLFFGLFGGLIAATIAKKDKHLVILGLILLMAAIAIVDHSVLSSREPFWYLLTAPALKITGIFIGYKLQIKQLKSVAP